MSKYVLPQPNNIILSYLEENQELLELKKIDLTLFNTYSAKDYSLEIPAWWVAALVQNTMNGTGMQLFEDTLLLENNELKEFMLAVIGDMSADM